MADPVAPPVDVLEDVQEGDPVPVASEDGLLIAARGEVAHPVKDGILESRQMAGRMRQSQT